LDNSDGSVNQLFLARARTVDVDRREGPLLGDAAIQMDFRIARAFEFFENDVVHFRSGVDQRGGENGQAAAFFDVAPPHRKIASAAAAHSVHAAVSTLPELGTTVL